MRELLVLVNHDAARVAGFGQTRRHPDPRMSLVDVWWPALGIDYLRGRLFDRVTVDGCVPRGMMRWEWDRIRQEIRAWCCDKNPAPTIWIET